MALKCVERCVFIVCVMALYCGAHKPKKQRPHIIFVLADDLGWGDVSFHGTTKIPTPNLDAMAYDGILLGNYYLQPICTPTRGALLTGRHPIHLGLQHGVIGHSNPYGLDLEETLLPQYLKHLGYSTHVIGKWHLGFYTWQHTPTFRGFDSHYGYFSGMEDYWDHTYAEGFWGLDWRRNKEPVMTDFGKYATELFTLEAESLIHNHNSSQPMLLYLAHLAVHIGNTWKPLEATRQFYDRFSYIKDTRRRTYAAMVAEMDASFGRVVRALHETGMLQDSVIVFSTDNGGAAGGDNGACNLPLRGSKAGLWEGGMRGAGFIWSPRLTHSRYTSHNMMQVFDWLPTLLEAAGYEEDQLPNNLDGVSQWESLSHNGEAVRNGMLHNIDPVDGSFAIRQGDMKLVYSPPSSSSANRPFWYDWNSLSNRITCDDQSETGTPDITMAMRHCDVTQVLHSIGRGHAEPRPFALHCGKEVEDRFTNCNYIEAPCLFNITADPCEYHNLAETMPHVVLKLLDLIAKYNETAVPICNKDADIRADPAKFGGVWTPWIKANEDEAHHINND